MRKLTRGVSVGLWFVCVACSGGTLTTKVVDAPQGSTTALGAPRNPMYSFEAEPELDQLRLHLYRSAHCDVIPTQVVNRRTETWNGSHLVSSVDQGTVQVAKPATTEVLCDQGYARDMEVSLIIGNATHLLGTTDAYGYVGVNLSAELREKLFGQGVPPNAMVRVRGLKGQPAQEIGMLSLASLRDFETGISRMLDELSALLSKGSDLSSADIQRTYELYEKLRALAWYDPRFKAASARFWELFFARKQVDATQNLSRNLKALDAAKDLLKSAGVGTIPLFMQLAIQNQAYDPRALDWASGELLAAIRARPQLCTSFDWTQLSSYGFLPPTQLAVQYLRFAQGDSFYAPIAGRCSFITRG
ncbi:MAG TPA: hypothetical protein VHB79_01940 [Polyangiaceae bacterium]|nr:hypothetical protein [Polyangiaceae bacterium]